VSNRSSFSAFFALAAILYKERHSPFVSKSLFQRQANL